MNQNEFEKIWIPLLEKAHAFSKNLEYVRAKEGWRGNHAQNMAIYMWRKVHNHDADDVLRQKLKESFKET